MSNLQQIITITDFRPPPRVDTVPWSMARIEEAASPDGTWTVLIDQALSPIDPDPTQPAVRAFTFAATLEHGWYQVTFLDGEGGQAVAAPVHNAERSGELYRPTVSQIGALLRQRTIAKSSGGREIGTFTADTRPSAEQVEDIIDDAVAQVQMDIGQTLPEKVWDMAQSVIGLYSAMLVELTFFAGDVAANRSPYAQFEKLYAARLASLKTAVTEAASGGEPGSVDTSLTPIYSFPTAPCHDAGW